MSSRKMSGDKSANIQADIHGLQNIASSNRTMDKVFWTVIIGIGMICVSYQIFELVRHFKAEPVVTNVGVVYPEKGMEIPNITVCILTKLNSTKLDKKYPKINRTLADFVMNSAFSAYSTALMDPDFFSNRGYNETALYVELERLIHGKPLVEFFEDVTFECPHLFLKCWFENGEIFDCCDSASPVTARRFLLHNGPCYYFESHNLHQRMSGPVGGFGFVYSHPPQDHVLPTVFGSYDVHAIYLFSNPASAMIERNPILIPIGAHAHISMKATKTVKQVNHGVPFIGGEDCPTKHLSLFHEYSYEACQVQCMVDTFMNNCNCTGLNTYGKIREKPLCPPHIANLCFKKLALNFTTLLGLCRHSECPETCEYWTYSHSITLGKVFFPGLELEQSNYWRIDLSETENLVMADVYFSEILYTEITQVSGFTFKQLLSSIGGALGLWVGASIITIIDIVWFIVFGTLVPTFLRKKNTDAEALRRNNAMRFSDKAGKKDKSNQTLDIMQPFI